MYLILCPLRNLYFTWQVRDAEEKPVLCTGAALHAESGERGEGGCGGVCGGFGRPARLGLHDAGWKAGEKSRSEGSGTRVRPNPYAKATEGLGGTRPAATKRSGAPRAAGSCESEWSGPEGSTQERSNGKGGEGKKD
ncbi:hypothetical protein B0H13DRAFT_1852033 [Mycena leptocephala]|nr:hypothetical protein B0H13DRAFT_1852033 [Mycena leptocephala]